MKKSLFSTLLIVISAAMLYGADITLKNENLSLSIMPECGGMITLIENKNAKFEFTLQDVSKNGIGLATERVFGDSCDFSKAPWKIVSQSSRAVKLQVTGLPPHRKLEITKTYTLPEKGAYVRVDLSFRNTNPVAGSFNVVPWIHNGFVMAADEAEAGNSIFFSHSKGVKVVAGPFKTAIQPTIKNTGNWCAYINAKKKQGVLMISEQKPEAFYSFISKSTTTLEMLYKSTNCIPETKYTYYLAPISMLTNESVAALGLPLKPLPAISAKRCDGEKIVLDSYFRQSEEKTIPFNVKFYKDTAYISPDVVLPIVFGVRNTSKGKLEFEIDLPDFVSLDGYTGNSWWHENEDMTLKNQTTVSNNGKKYNRFRFDISARRLNQWMSNHCRIFLHATAEQGKDQITFRGFLDGKQLVEQLVPCEVIRIPVARTPKKFTVMFGLDYAIWNKYPQFQKNMKHLGLNGLCFNYNVPNKAVSADQVRAMNSELKKAGFTTAVMGVLFIPPYILSGDVKSGREYKTLDINGKPVNNFDFTLRGPWMQKVFDKSANKTLCLGYDIAISDYEAYFGGERIGFSPAAVTAFKKYFKEKYPNKEWIEPAAAVNESAKYPEQYKIWTDFKCERYADYLESMIRKAREKDPSTKIGWCTISGASDEYIKIDNLQDTAKHSSFLDYNMPMLYNNVYLTMSKYRDELEMFRKLSKGKRALLAPTLTTGLWGRRNNFPSEHIYFILLETALQQCAGAYIFPGFSGTDNMGMKYLSQAIDKIAEIENVIDGATRQDHQITIKECRNTELNIPSQVKPLVLIKDNKMLVWLAEYTTQAVTLKADFRLPSNCKFTTLSGTKRSGVMRKGEDVTISLTPGVGKGALLLLETSDGKPFPLLKEEVKKAQNKVDETGMVFYDGFDGTTKGQNGSKKHSFRFYSDGKKGKSLSLRNYEAFWILPQKIDIKSSDVTFDFWFQPTQNFGPNSRRLWDLIRGNISEKQLFDVYFNQKTGKITCAIGIRNAQGKIVDWKHTTLSDTCQWAGNLWMHIKLSIGKSGMSLVVNDKKEFDIKPVIDVRHIENLQLGRPWVSAGYYDELRVFDGKK